MQGRQCVCTRKRQTEPMRPHQEAGTVRRQWMQHRHPAATTRWSILRHGEGIKQHSHSGQQPSMRHAACQTSRSTTNSLPRVRPRRPARLGGVVQPERNPRQHPAQPMAVRRRKRRHYRPEVVPATGRPSTAVRAVSVQPRRQAVSQQRKLAGAATTIHPPHRAQLMSVSAQTSRL